MSQRIVVVDDDINIQTLLKQLLKMEGYEDVLVFGSGLEALGYLSEDSCDLIFLDVEMPGMDGWLLCEILHNVKRWAKIPVVFQSALVGAVNIKRGIALGAHSYLEKPYTRLGVKEVVAGVFKPNKPKVESTPEIKMVVTQVAEATKQTFNLMLGAQTHVLEVEALDSRALSPSWDFAGSIPAEGTAQIEISMGWSRGLAASAAIALMQLEEDELDDELILDSMQEILNMVLGAAVRIIGKTYPVKLCLPKGGQNCGIPYDNEAQHQFRVEMKTRDWVFPMLVTVRPPSQQAAA